MRGIRERDHLPTLEEFREKKREDWEAMSNEDLGVNINGYRTRMLDDARAHRLRPWSEDKPDRGLVTPPQEAAYQKVITNPDQYHPLGKASYNIGLSMAQNDGFHDADRTMCENLSGLIKHRNRVAAREAGSGREG